MQKTKTGAIVPWNWGSRFRDGSLRVDVPIQSLNLLFNGACRYYEFDTITHFSISQPSNRLASQSPRTSILLRKSWIRRQTGSSS